MKKIKYFLPILLFFLFIPSLTAECKSISEYGAVGDGLTDDTEAFQNALNDTGIINLEEGKTYYLSKGLLIPSTTIINGNNASIIIDNLNFFMDETNPSENNGKGLFFYQFFFPKNYNSTSQLLEINNLRINWNVSQSLTHVNTYYLFLINDINKAVFNSVSITIGGYSKNSIQPFKFNSQADEVVFDNCSIYNYSHGNDGSCIWFHANDIGGYPNVTISNSLFYSEAHDELISAWGPYQKHITVSNCVFLRHCVPCLGLDRKNVTPNYICLVSKSTPDLSDTYCDENDNSSSIKYKYCNFYITSESENTKPYYFITSSSYYNTAVKTYFQNCNIYGSFSKAFISGETSTDTTSNDSNTTYHTNIGIFFDNCYLDISAPTLITTRSTNTTFSNCTIKTDNYLMDTLYVDTNLIACSYFNLTNNTFIIQNNLTTLFKGLSHEHCNQVFVHNNTFFCPSSERIDLYTLSDRNYSSYAKIHSLNAKSIFSFSNNKIISKQP